MGLENYLGFKPCVAKLYKAGYATMPRCTASDNDAKRCIEGKECVCEKPKTPAPAAVAA